MTWARLDDSFPEHPKVVGLSAPAFRLHVTALCYCARTLTDGVIATGAIRLLGGAKKEIGELVGAELWEERAAGWAIHDYLVYNPSREQVLSERDKRSAAGKAGANSRWQGKSDGKSHSDRTADRIDIADAPVPVPDPPSGSKDPSASARRKKPRPEDVPPPFIEDELRERMYAKYKPVASRDDVEVEIQRALKHYHAKALRGEDVDYGLSVQSWLRTAFGKELKAYEERIARQPQFADAPPGGRELLDPWKGIPGL